MDALKLTVSQLEPYVLSEDQMKTWGYVVEVPPGPGGDKPHEEGSVMICERCTQKFVVKRCEEADQCRFHWGKAFTSRVDGKCLASPIISLTSRPDVLYAGERRRLYTCCSRTADEEGCATGPHVFYEKDPENLHRRHAFTHSRPPQPAGDTALDIVALDCEMIYTTGGMRVARVSVIDSSGKEVLDELVRMDEGVEVM